MLGSPSRTVVDVEDDAAAVVVDSGWAMLVVDSDARLELVEPTADVVEDEDVGGVVEVVVASSAQPASKRPTRAKAIPNVWAKRGRVITGNSLPMVTH
jgi:hypothetical protein